MAEDDGFFDWLAGFVAGEGYFGITKESSSTQWSTRLTIGLRDDDLPILIAIQERLEMGRISHAVKRLRDGSDSRPQATWCTLTNAGCLKLVTIFDRHPIRAKKEADYLVWREAVIENRKPPQQRDLRKMRYLADKICLVRTYEPQDETTYEPNAIQLTFPEEDC